MKGLNPSQEIQYHLEKIQREKSAIDRRRHKINNIVNRLEREDADLLYRFNELEILEELCHQSLLGEPIAIWAELDRFRL
ncbi:MAG: hypothetical protein OXT74_04715 [Candidatus Poribacteria bacterium]|nr:hypothetical protein [Candidatus Poribacteria bacterium]